MVARSSCQVIHFLEYIRSRVLAMIWSHNLFSTNGLVIEEIEGIEGISLIPELG